MPNLIIVRLHPVEPVDAATFTSFVSGLTIRAFDLSFADSVAGLDIGAASGVADPHLPSTTNNNVNVHNTGLLQHYLDVPNPANPALKLRVLESVATAVIIVSTPAGYPEYPTDKSFDIRLEITRGGQSIVDRALNYNVVVTTVGSLSTNQKNYFAMAPSAYVALPSSTVGLDPNVAYVDLPADGRPPVFDDLVKAIDLVLARDPGGASAALHERPPLTAAQSRQVAAEIVWNRTLYPPPEPRRPLGELYTWPLADPNPGGPSKDDIDRDRAQFEAELTSYRSTHDAEALRLTAFVFAASSAVACETMSLQATKAGLEFPLITGSSTGTEIPDARVVLTLGASATPFVVPAAFFYALAATMPTQVTPAQRYDMARLQREARLLGDIQTAIDNAVIVVPAAPLTIPASPALNVDQAARRLHALGAIGGFAPEVALAPLVTPIVTDWLAHAGPTATIEADFWIPEGAAQPAAYLELVLEVLTENHAPLIAAIKAPPLSVANVAALVAITDQSWRAFFLGPPPQIALLPSFTQPGTPTERVEAFIRHLRKFFAVPSQPGTPAPIVVAAPPLLGGSIDSIFEQFADAYLARAGTAFVFGGTIDASAQAQAIVDVFPTDVQAQAWLAQAIATIDALYRMTDLGPGFAELHVSLMEALFARGFTGPQDAQGLSVDEFQDALMGTVAYSHAAAIYALAGVAPLPAEPPAKPFQSINPDGSLTDCVPPPHLSPFGATAYLAEMLRVSAASTCAEPFPASEQTSIAHALEQRRGSLDHLHATAANLGTPLPLIDLVNESLEALVDGLPGAIGGAVYDTAGDALAGHALRAPGEAPSADSDRPYRHDAQTLFAALPEHSTPATPVEKPGAYDKLKSDFTAPWLPYHQPLDVTRSYLRALRTTRFAAMRALRRDVTEFVIDPAHEPADFQRHLWRYPVRFAIALEYLGLSAEENDRLFAHDIVTAPTPDRLLLREAYGFPSDTIDGRPWTQIIVEVPEFLRRTGLDYCAFLALWRCGYVAFVREGAEADFPECLPCCPDRLRIAFPAPLDPLVALRKLAVFIRVWHKLRQIAGSKVSFAQLRDICDVLTLFDGDAVNPDFVRELAALFMLREFLNLPLADPDAPAPSALGADRTHLLALWVGPAAARWDWAVALLLEHIDAYAEARYPELRRAPELIKIIADNLDPLSRLAGFDPGIASDTWHARPTSTLRFVEVLAKIYTSGFTVGEILFLFTAANHLPGDDPFRLTDPNEALEDPANLPEDQDDYRLWALRRKLLDVDVDDESADHWSWRRILVALRDELGFVVPSGTPDPLDRFAEHFFPSMLERHGQPVALTARQYRVDLAATATSPLMWNMPPDGPFRYDPAAQQLWTQVPLRDDVVIKALQEMRALTDVEQAAVRDLYFAPRSDIAQLAFIFANFGEAVDRLTHEPDESARWSYFRRAFATFYRRCRIIAQHLAEHVAAETDKETPEGDTVAWKVLRHLYADENFAKSTWEADSGVPPDVTWGPQPHGGAFAALLGLTGTGLLAEFRIKGATVWRETGGALTAFGGSRNEWNTPVPVIVPAMNVALTAEQQRFVVVRNGLALRDVNGEPLGGAQPFGVRWSGVLVVESAGPYRFHAGAPTPEGQAPDLDGARDHKWRLTLRRGQKSWILLNRHWAGEDAPDACSGEIHLQRGAYDIVVEFEQVEPRFATAEEICRRHCGFEIKYEGPDSDQKLVVVPLERLYRDYKTEPLGAGLELTGAAAEYLDRYYTSTMRDIRRTYQRAFKALLFVHRFHLSAKQTPSDRQSELGYMLGHGSVFLGTSYPRTGASAFGVHRAHFDFNLLPVTDPYRAPAPAQDARHQPSAKRQGALFDFWERLWDYTLMRTQTRPARERPAWLLFFEASERQPDDPPQLVRHLGIDIRHAPLVLTYFASPAPHAITTPELEDERWAVRIWHAEQWVRGLQRHFFAASIADARPASWASDDPNAPFGTPPMSGNANLTAFMGNGTFENGAPRRYEDVTVLDDGLRERARAALVAYLCGMDRVTLPWGGHAKVARDLSDLLLQDVETGVCERASRIEEAVSAVQKFVQRARLGLEPTFVVTPAFTLLWDSQFADYRIWESCKRRWIYRENWIGWTEMERARGNEAFRFLQDELRRATLTVPVPGGLEHWNGRRPPAYPGLTLLQSREPAGIRLLAPGPDPEGLDLLGTPERDARPSWLAPLFRMRQDGGGGDDGGGVILGPSAAASASPLPVPLERLPLWIQAAIRLGTRFVRVAAAALPPASTSFVPREHDEEGTCCADCGCVHPPLVDEYYFWLHDARGYTSDDRIQDADEGATPPEMESDWHRPEKLPGLLHWPSIPLVHLYWCRVHNGEFGDPRRSSEALRIDPASLVAGAEPQLDFIGRIGDSLRFEVSGSIAPSGYLDPTPPGFRYDLASDAAVVLPLVAAPPALPPFVGGLIVYPYFAHFAPGAPLLPRSMFAEATAVAGSLRAHCRFEAALKWYALVFDPLHEDTTWAQCPVTDTPTGDTPPILLASSAARGGDIACCPTAPVADAIARKRAIALAYLETLLQWADASMCRNTPEAFQQAEVMLETLRRVLGERPLTIFARDDAQPMTLASFQPRPPPLNPRLLSLYDRSADRAALVHHCLNAHRLRNGRPNADMPYFGHSELRDGWMSVASACDDECHPCCNAYRFTFLVQKALELADEVRSMGNTLLAAYEKGDAEYLASLHATQERQLLQLAIEIKQNQWRDADWQVQALRKAKESAQTRLRYYETLLANGLNSGEIGYGSLTDVSMASRTSGNVSEMVAQSVGATPDAWYGVAGIMGSPLAFQQLPVGNKLAYGFATAARIMNALAEIASSDAQLHLTEGGWDRREDEWRHIVEVTGIEIEQTERLILGAERRRDIALRELGNHRRQLENAIEAHDFLRDKFTNHELYLFLQQETAALHRQAYELALDAAQRAQRAFNVERGYTARKFLPEHPCDNLHESLTAGEKLLHAVRHMEKAYCDANCREYELTKHISLRLHFPQAFLHLQTTGYCEIDVPEWMFDLDYPGHYMRRLKNVSVTIPCVVGPYTGVHCRLTLLSSRTRVDPRLNPSPACCCNERECPDTYRPLPDDPRIVRTYAATEAIATSSGQNDSGLFDLRFSDERYLPFEFAGAVSRWRIELPHENNQWPPDSLSDLILHVSYTAREGGDVLRRVASKEAQRHLPGAGVRLFDVRHEFADAWEAFHGSEKGKRPYAELPVRLTRRMFPFLSGRRAVQVHRLELLFEAKGAKPGASRAVEFLAGEHWRHLRDGDCDCERHAITCVASAEWPDLYHGVLEIAPRTVREDTHGDFGALRFLADTKDVERVFVLGGYRVDEYNRHAPR